MNIKQESAALMAINNVIRRPCDIRRLLLVIVLAAMQAATQATWAKPSISLQLSGTADDNDGRSLDADASISNASWWQLGFGGGSSRSESSTSTLRSTSIRTSAEVYSDRFGLRGYYQHWQAAPYALKTTGARASYTAGNLRLSITGEAKNLSVDYTADPFTGRRDTARFNGSGWGVGSGYRHHAWGGYVSGMWYRYGSLSSYVQTQINNPTFGAPPGPANSGALPGSQSLPPLDLAPPIAIGSPGLTGSLMALNQGAVKRQLSAGVLRDFTNCSIYLDWAGSEDAIFARTVNYYSASYLYQFTNLVHATVTVGTSRASSGSTGYGGLSLGFDF